MKKIICNLLILGALCVCAQFQAQHLLEALDAPLFSSTQSRSASKTFTRNNCNTGHIAGTWTVTRTVTATATSDIDQIDADSKASTIAYNNALAIVNAEGQAEANINGSCTVVYTSTQTRSFSKDFTRNNCSDSGKAIGVFTYTQSATATSTSHISQEDADKKASDIAYNNAVNLVNSNGQNQANSNSKCLWTVSTSDVTSKRYPGYNSGGTNYGEVTITATSYYTAVSDISYQDASNKATSGARRMNQNYLNSSSSTIGLAFSKPAYLCYDEYEEEYITGDGQNGLPCPTSRRNAGRSMTRESTSNITFGWSWNGSYGATCTLRAVNWQNPSETRTTFQSLTKYKRTVCSNNTLPQSRHHSVMVGIHIESYNK